MDFEIIDTVLTLASTGSFSETAYEISCAQSTVSRRIEAAEQEIGARLFSRPDENEDKKLHLTPTGERVIPIMQRIYDEYDELLTVAQAEMVQNSTIHIGVMNFMTPLAYSIIKMEFFEAHPNINLDINTGHLDRLLNELKNRRLDAVLFCCSALEPEVFGDLNTIKIRLLGKAPLSIGVSDMSEFSKDTVIRMDALKNETFILQMIPDDIPGVKMHSKEGFLSRIEQSYGFTPKILAINSDMREIRYQMVKNGKGVIPSYTPAAWRAMPGIHYLELVDDAERYMNYYLLSRDNERAKSLQLFSDYLAKSIASQNG